LEGGGKEEEVMMDYESENGCKNDIRKTWWRLWPFVVILQAATRPPQAVTIETLIS